jgi:tetratricopeptide (TPR) repeat protein
LAEGVHRFEGTVNQYTGDGIMALFGAPIAHEDHAQRACYAALHLRDALKAYADALRVEQGLNFSTRMGINSGDVVVGRIGNDLRMDYTAQGHTVGLAQRMEALAESGKVMLAGATIDLVQGYFALRDLGSTKIKGVDAAVRVAELEGIGQLRTRFDRSRARGLSKFAGRTNEMATLDAALEQALAGHGQVVGIVADAGTGKSRLCFEFTEGCRAKGIRVHSTTGVSHGKAVPLLPVLELYYSSFGITAQDDARTAQQKIAGNVVQNDDSLVPSLPLLFDFLGVPDPDKPVAIEPGPERQRALLSVLKRLTLARSRREPEVILFEDLHWIDEATEVFLANLVDAADASRTLLLVNFRPEYRAEWTRRSYYQQLALAPLDARAFAEMLGETLGPDPSLRDLIERIHARSGGNPFFAEEIVQSLIESGVLEGTTGACRLTRSVDALDIPATVQLVLAARIDRLGEREKNVLQTASVIGRDFGLTLLRRVADLDAGALDAALRALVQAEFLHETAIYPEAEYAFKHPLTQEVALGSQLRERRARAHAAVASALIELHGSDLDEQAALLAHHYEAAGDAAEAVRWHERAAAALEGRDPNAERHHWTRLLELVGDPPAATAQTRAALRACSQLLRLATTLGLDFPRGEALYHRGRALAAQLDEPSLGAGLIGSFGFFAVYARQMPLALAAAEEALRLAPRVSDPVQYAQVIDSGTFVFLLAGRRREALAVVEAALASGKVTSSTPVALAQLLLSRGMMLTGFGRLAEARATLDRAAQLLSDGRRVLLVLRIEVFRIVELAERGLSEGSLERIARLVARADSVGENLTRIMARVYLAGAHHLGGRPDAELETIEAALAIARETGVSLNLVGVMESFRAQALLARGDVGAARDLVERLVAVREPNPLSRTHILVRHAEVLVAADALGERTRIEASLNEAADVAERIDNPGAQALVRTALAHHARAVGDAAGWERELREALRIYTEMDATGWMERIERELAS